VTRWLSHASSSEAGTSDNLAKEEQRRSTDDSDGFFSAKTKSLRKNLRMCDANSAEASGDEADSKTCTKEYSDNSLKN